MRVEEVVHGSDWVQVKPGFGDDRREYGGCIEF